MSASKQFFATLVRGSTHFYGGKTYVRDEEREVTEAEKNYLEANAVETVGSGENEHNFPRFKFREASADAAPARSRSKADAS